MKDKPSEISSFRRHGWVLTAKQARRLGMGSRRLRTLVAEGRADRVGRGFYRWRDADVTINHGLALARRNVPGCVICLLSALQFHELTTQLPFEVWIAINAGRKSPPRNRIVPLRVFKFSGPAFAEGIETHRIEGTAVQVYSVAKTIADIFKHRNKIGLDVALEALREGWRKRRFRVDELMHYARVCRVANIIRPYAEVVIQEWGRRTNPADKRD